MKLFAGFPAWNLHRGELVPVFHFFLRAVARLRSIMGNWLSRTIHPQAETQEPKPGSDEKQEDVKSSPTVKSADSGVSSAKDAKLTTAKGSTSKTSTDAKAPETLQPKVPSSSQKQVTLNITEDNPSKISKPKATDSKVSQPKATDSKVSQPKATDSKVSQPKAADSKVSQPKAAEVLPAAVPSSSQKQDLPSKVPVTETPANEVSKDSTGAGGTATVPMPDENKQGLTKPTLFRSSLNRFWTSMQNFRESLSGRKSSSIPADHLNRVESETGLSNDLRVEVIQICLFLYCKGAQPFLPRVTAIACFKENYHYISIAKAGLPISERSFLPRNFYLSSQIFE